MGTVCPLECIERNPLITSVRNQVFVREIRYANLAPEGHLSRLLLAVRHA